MRYRLKPKVGLHIEAGKTYKAGDIVESANNLVELFPDKFEPADQPASQASQDKAAEEAKRKTSGTAGTGPEEQSYRAKK